MPDSFGRMTSSEAPRKLQEFCFPKAKSNAPHWQVSEPKEQEEKVERKKIERGTAEKIFEDLFGTCPHYRDKENYGDTRRLDCLRCVNELQTKYLGDSGC